MWTCPYFIIYRIIYIRLLLLVSGSLITMLGTRTTLTTVTAVATITTLTTLGTGTTLTLYIAFGLLEQYAT